MMTRNRTKVACNRTWRLVAFVCILAGSTSASAPPSIAEIDAMRAYVESHGLEGLGSAIAANQWSAPSIPSRWHLENKANPVDVAAGIAARAVGLSLLNGVDAWVPAMQTLQGEALLNRARSLIDVAQWVWAAPGYGNAIIAAHACDVAVTGLGRLTIDLAFPLDPVEAELQRCRLTIGQPPVRAHILNAEVGAAVFPESATQKDLELIYDLRAGRLELARLPEAKRQSGLAQRMKAEMRARGIDPDAPEPDPGFYTDDACSPRISATCWEKNVHQPLAFGLFPTTRMNCLTELVLFRRTIGAFPQQPTRPWRVWTPIKNAFADAWEPHEATLGSTACAASTYESIVAGRYEDSDTKERIAHGLATRIPTTPTPDVLIPTP